MLAVEPKSLICLVTPEANEFLARLEVKEITEEHLCNTLYEIDMRRTFIGLDLSLFDVMYGLKRWLQCDFQFKMVNRGPDIDILMVCCKSELILACFVIRCEPRENKVWQILASTR